MLVRVLLVEDNEDHAFFTVRALHQVNDSLALEIETLADGVDALDYLNRRGRFTDRQTPDLILLDLKMPRMDGFEVLDAVKRDPELRKTPVIVLTSSDEQTDIDRVYSMGANSYVVKPMRSDDLQDKVRHIPEYWTKINQLPKAQGALQ